MTDGEYAYNEGCHAVAEQVGNEMQDMLGEIQHLREGLSKIAFDNPELQEYIKELLSVQK